MADFSLCHLKNAPGVTKITATRRRISKFAQQSIGS